MGGMTNAKHSNPWGELATLESFDAPRELLSAVFSSTGIGVAVCDRRLRFQAINNSLAAMNGFPAEAHLGRKIHELLGDAAKKVGGAFDKVFTTGEPLAGVEIVAKLPGRTEVGYWVESYQPIRNALGRVKQVAVVVLEMTERRKLLPLNSEKHGVRDEGFPDLVVKNSPAESALVPPHLSPREQEVLRFLADGRTNKEIAAALDISPRTVEVHRARVMLKLDVHTVGQLVRNAIRHHLIKA